TVVERPLRDLLAGRRRGADSAAGPAGLGRRWLLAEALLLAALLAPVWLLLRAARSQGLRAADAEALAGRGDPAGRGVRFGEALLLGGADLTWVQGWVRLRLVWHCLREPEPYVLRLRVRAADGRTLAAWDRPRNPKATGKAWRGLSWQEKLMISPWDLPGA